MQVHRLLLVCAAVLVVHAQPDLQNIISDMLDDVGEFEEELMAFREAAQSMEGTDNGGEHMEQPGTIPPFFDYIGNYQGHSYYLIHEDRQTWHNARANCQAAGMDMIALETAEEHQWLRNNWMSGSYRTCWSGANELPMGSFPRQFYWSVSGDEVDMDQEGLWFGGVEPNIDGSHCAFFAGYQLAEYPCSDRDCYLCETTDTHEYDLNSSGVEATESYEDIQSAAGTTPPFFDYIGSYQSHSYYLIHEDRQTWHDARASCQAAGMDLIALETVEEHRWLQDNWMSGSYRTCWSGANELPMVSFPRQFYWSVSGDEVDMDQEGLWRGGFEPNTDGSHCAFFAGYQLADYTCSDRDCYLCETTDTHEYDLNSSGVSETTESYIYEDIESGAACGILGLNAPDVYTIGSRCYFISSYSFDWDSARANCQEKGLELATIDNRGTQEFLEMILHMRDYWYQPFWVGARRDDAGTFRWVALNNAAVDAGYTNWHEGEPNNWEGYEGCMLIWENYQWNDTDCELPRPYICQGYIS